VGGAALLLAGKNEPAVASSIIVLAQEKSTCAANTAKNNQCKEVGGIALLSRLLENEPAVAISLQW